MKNHMHKLSGIKYRPVNIVERGVIFQNVITGVQSFFSDYHIELLLTELER